MTTKIRAALITQPQALFSIEEIEIEDPKHDEALVRVISSGICHTDLGAREGHYNIPMPCVLGHEGAGIVEKVGSNSMGVEVGDRVIMNVDQCGTCEGCRAGTPYCEKGFQYAMGFGRASPLHMNGTVIHGNFFSQSSFATHAVAPIRCLAKVPSEIDLTYLGPLACSGVTGAGAVLNAFKCLPGSSIAVYGAGGVGLCAVMAARIAGCKTIVVVDIKPERLALALELGATHILNGQTCEPVKEIIEITQGGVDFALECVGRPEAMQNAFRSLCVRGICGITGQVTPGESISLDPYAFLGGRTLKGLVRGESSKPQAFIARLIDAFLKGQFPIDKMVRFYPLEKINEAVDDMAQDRCVKAVLRPNG